MRKKRRILSTDKTAARSQRIACFMYRCLSKIVLLYIITTFVSKMFQAHKKIAGYPGRIPRRKTLLSHDLRIEALPAQLCRHIKILAYRLRNAGETFARSQVDTRQHRSSADQKGHVFARVIRGRRCGIAPVIRGNNQHIFRAEDFQKLFQLLVEFRCRCG